MKVNDVSITRQNKNKLEGTLSSFEKQLKATLGGEDVLMPGIGQKDGSKKSNAQDPLVGHEPPNGSNGKVDKNQVFTLFTAIAEMGKSFATQSRTSANLLDASMDITKKLQVYLNKTVAYQNIQATIKANYLKHNPPWLQAVDKYVGQVMSLVFSITMGMVTGGPAGAIAAAAVTITVDLMNDIPLNKEGQVDITGKYTAMDLMFQGIKSPTGKFFAKLGFILAVSIVAGGATSVSIAAKAVATNVIDETLTTTAEEVGTNTAEEVGTNTAEKVAAKGARWGLRGFAVGLNAFTTMMNGVKSYDIAGKDGNPGERLGIWGDVALAFGNTKTAEKVGGEISTALGIGLMLAQLGMGYGLSKVEESIESMVSSNVQRVITGVDLVAGGTQGIMQGQEAYTSALSAYYDNQMASVSSGLTEIQKNVANLEVIKQSIGRAIQSSLQQGQGIMNAIMSGIQDYTQMLGAV